MLADIEVQNHEEFEKIKSIIKNKPYVKDIESQLAITAGGNTPSQYVFSLTQEGNPNTTTGIRTQIALKIRREDVGRLRHFLSDKGLASEPQEFPANEQGYITLEVRFSKKLSWSKRRDVEKEIISRGGEVTSSFNYGDRPPRISQKTKTMLTNGMILAALAYFSTLGGSRGFPSIDIIQAAQLAIIPAVVAFLTKIAEDRGILRKTTE